MSDTPGMTTPDPDPEARSHSTVPSRKGGSGLPENVAGALSYLLGPLTGIAFFIIDRERPFVRFHAVQCIALTVAWVVLWMATLVLGIALNVIPFLGAIIGFFLTVALTVAGFGLWLWLLYQAYSGNEWEIPGLGSHVRRIAAEAGGAGSAPMA
jgi:uncharacterized membrane protein